MDLDFEQMLAEHEEKYENAPSQAPYLLAQRFKAEKYATEVVGTVVISFGFGPGQSDPDELEEAFFLTHTHKPDDKVVKDECISDRVLRGEIAQWLQESNIEITLDRVDLILLCLQTV